MRDYKLEEDEIDLREIFSIIKRKIVTVFIVTFLSIIFAIAYLYWTKNIYSSSTILSLDGKDSGLGIGSMLNQFGFGGMMGVSSNSDIQKAITVITSKKFLRTILDKIDVDKEYFILRNFRKIEVEKFENLEIKIEVYNKAIYEGFFKIVPLNDEEFILEVDKINFKKKIKYGKTIKNKYFKIKVNSLNGIDPYDINITTNNSISNFIDKNFNLDNRKIYIFKKLSVNMQLEKLINNLSLEDKKSNMLEIKYKGTLPNKVYKIVSIITKSFIDFQVKEKSKEYNRNLNIVDKHIKDISKDISHQVKKIEKFQTDNVVAVNIDTQELVNNIYTKKQELEKILLQITEIDNFVKSLKKGVLSSALLTNVGIDINPIQKLMDNFLSIDSSIRELEFQQLNIDKSVTTNPQIEFFINKLKEKKDILDMLLASFTEKHPQIIKQKKEIEILIDKVNKNISINLERLREEKDVVVSAILENIYMIKRNLLEKRSLLENEIQKEEKLLNSIPPSKIASDILNRTFKFNEKIYTVLLNKKIDIEIDKSALIANTKILEDAYIPEKRDKPKVGLILGASGIIGVILGVFVVFFREFLNKKIRDFKSIENLIRDIPVHGVISNKNKNLIKEQLLNLKIDIDSTLQGVFCKEILITSIKVGEGKSAVASKISKIIAENGNKVILVDFNLQNPKLHKIFKLSNKFGISDYVLGNNIQKKYTLILQVNKYLHFIPVGSSFKKLKGIDLSNNKNFKDLIMKLEKEYEYVIFNSNTADNPNTRILFKYSDISLFVLKKNFSTIDEIERIEKIKNVNKLERIGIILN